MRVFVVAPSVARLIRREWGSTGAVEAYMPTRSNDNTHVVIEGAEGRLVLVTRAAGEAAFEEITRVPHAQAVALLDVAAGQLEVERTPVPLDGCECVIERLVKDGASIDVAVVSGHDEGDIAVPAWFGREIKADRSYLGRTFALEGLPAIDAPVTDIEIDAVLDMLDGRSAVPAEAEPATLVSVPAEEQAPVAEEVAPVRAAAEEISRVLSRTLTKRSLPKMIAAE